MRGKRNDAVFKARKPAGPPACWLPACTGIVILGWLLFMADRGLDFTDEGYYLNCLAYPFDYPSSVTQFGFVYHPLFRLFDGDIASLRRANIAIVYALSWAVASIAFRRWQGFGSASMTGQGWHRSLLAAGVGGCGLVFFSIFHWLPTASYNSLCLQAILMVAIGTLSLGRRDKFGQALAVTCLGCGGCAAFLAKPTSAMLAALLVACHAMLRGRRETVLCAVSAVVATGLLGAFASAVDGDVGRFLARLKGGLAEADLLLRPSSGGSPVVAPFSLLERAGPLCIMAIGAVVCSACARRICGWISPAIAAATAGRAAIASRVARLAWLRSQSAWGRCVPWRFTARAIPIAAGCLLGASGLVMLDVLPLGLSPTVTWNVLAVAVGVTAVVLAWVRFSTRSFTPRFRRDLGDVGFLAALPCAYVFGTGNRYADVFPGAAILWIVAAVILCRWLVRERHAMAAACLAVALFQFATAASLAYGMRMPYRQTTPLWSQRVPVDCAGGRSRLRLDAATAGYLHDLRVSLRSQGFVPGDSVLDCSGFSPGVIHAVGGRPIGAAWLIGTCPGSLEYARATVGQVPAERLAAAWILTDENGPFTIDTSFLKQFGRDIDRDYDRVVSLVAPDGFRGLASGTAPIRQHFYRPRAASAAPR